MCCGCNAFVLSLLSTFVVVFPWSCARWAARLDKQGLVTCLTLHCENAPIWYAAFKIVKHRGARMTAKLPAARFIDWFMVFNFDYLFTVLAVVRSLIILL